VDEPQPLQYPGLYGEVVTEDVYKLRDLDFEPDLVFDIGANVGYFTHHVINLFPNTFVVAVEPDPTNFAALIDQIENFPNCVYIPRALGRGSVYRCHNTLTGPHETYLSEGLGYSWKDFENDYYTKQEIQCISLSELFDTHHHPRFKCVVKLDCEGGENSIISNQRDTEALKQADYIAMELHFFAAHGGKQKEVDLRTFEWFGNFRQTHHITINREFFYARKKQ